MRPNSIAATAATFDREVPDAMFSRLSKISRSRKLRLFYDTLCPTQQSRVLDVGGEIDADGEKNVQLIDSYPWKERLHTINLLPEHVQRINAHYPEVTAVVGDARNLPWPDKYFDIVYSNAVIEHVGDWQSQLKMASEIRRVGKRWFVTTPNRWYPFEFHYRLPFVTWLPGGGYQLAGRVFSYSHVRRKYVFGMKRDPLRLLTARRLQECFPGSKIVKQRVTFMAETLIAIGGEQ